MRNRNTKAGYKGRKKEYCMNPPVFDMEKEEKEKSILQ